MIQWCNDNVGFATIVLSALTLLVSIIAIFVSIRTARLPYKKLIKIEAGSYFTTDGASGLHVTAINCGNMDFTISSMGCRVNGKRIYIAGDTGATKEARQVKCDIALLPIGGTFTMDAKRAADLANTIRPEYAIPVHYGGLVGKKSDAQTFASLVKSPVKVVEKMQYFD
ncbi:MBL fold metallo-hydrolase [Butyrivibrio hungatei]|nr:MBL fold metallo-hydrolase [Butyrivibrio hungatei]